MDAFSLFLLTQLAITVPASIGFALLYVQGGLLSFGYALWVGLGGYVFWGLQLSLHHAWSTAFTWPLLLLGTALCMALPAWLCAIVLTRSVGMVFAMTSLALCELVHVHAQMQPDWFGGEAGISVLRPFWLGERALALGCAVLACVLLLGYVRFLHSRWALLLTASHDHALRLQVLGHSVLRIRSLTFAAAAALSAVSGVLQLWLLERSSDAAFALDKSYTWVLYSVLSTLLLSKSMLTQPRTAWLVVPLSSLLMVIGQLWLPRYTSASALILGLLFILAALWQARPMRIARRG